MEQQQLESLYQQYSLGKYLSRDELLYRLNRKNQKEFGEIWAYISKRRQEQGKVLPLKTQAGSYFWYLIPPFVEQKVHQIDSVAKRKLEEIVTQDIRHDLLLESMFDEAFHSSMIEGAFSTKKRAKEVVANRSPENKSEQMILNNYEAMMFVLEHLDEEITDKVIIHLQHILTKNTLEEEDITDRYRTDQVFVKDATGEVIYEAPPEHLVEKRMNELIQFINQKDPSTFIHPMVKASIIHFYVGYIHPFFDGNGRVARALSYMYLLQEGYDFFKFFSISSIISKHRRKYYQSFVKSEQPEGDLTYFIMTHMDMTAQSIEEVIERLSLTYNEQLLEKKLAEDRILLSERQKKFLKYAARKDSNLFTVQEYKQRYKVVYETARKDLNELEVLGLLKKMKKGKKFIYIFQGLRGYLEK